MSNIRSATSSKTRSKTASNATSNTAKTRSQRPSAKLETSPSLPWIFNLEGTFLGFLGEAPDHVTAMVLEVDQEQMAIKLPKNLCEAVKHAVRRRVLPLGAQVRCIGRSQLNFSAGVIELKAYCLFLNPGKPTLLAATSANQPASKIMVCHKSGCKKRGGRQLVEALERALKDYQLQYQVEIQYTGCQKCCAKAPGLVIMPGKHRYDGLRPEAVSALIEKHFC